MDASDLTDDELETLLENPEVRKTLQYEEVGLPEIADLLADFRALADDEDSDVYTLFTEGVAERSGRVTDSTVKKVIDGMIEEVDSVTNGE